MASEGKSRGGSGRIVGALAIAGIGAWIKHSGAHEGYDVLNGLDSGTDYGNLKLQTMITAFCLSPIPGKLLQSGPSSGVENGNYTFAEEGSIEDEDYAQSSIYAALYGMYKNAPELVSNHGVKYQFTFNTWGIAPSPYPESDPQRHGKAAYAALVTQPPVLEYIKNQPEGYRLQIAEVGCGTGAGANLITREVHPTSEYLAMDMQQAAINTCNKIHATPDNQGLTCLRIPNGVGINGGKIPRDNNTLDMVVISETHIADMEIGALEKSIFDEIYRVLKPGGLFVWGNALPTRVWHQGNAYLPTAGFELAFETNHTKGAITARDEDFDRVELAMDQLMDPYYVMQLPYFGERCRRVGNRLIANFYRHPGTALYLKMTTGYDSYMHQAWKVIK